MKTALTAAIKRLPEWARGMVERRHVDDYPAPRPNLQARVLRRLLGEWELRFYYRRLPRDKRNRVPSRCFLYRGSEFKRVREDVFRYLRDRGAIHMIENRPNYSVWGITVKVHWRPGQETQDAHSA